jgi:membrane protein implicated in regulation of membrane protease activity
MAVAFWVIIMVVSGLAELHTNALAGLFVGVGAAVAFVVALGGASFPVQAVVWLGVTAVTMAFLRPVALKRLHRHPPGDLANPVDSALTGQFGVVQDEVGDEIHPGRIKVRGETWRAVTESGATLAVATPVVVTRAFGTTLYVVPRPGGSSNT